MSHSKYIESKLFTSPNYHTLDTDPDLHSTSNDPAYQTIRSRQIISNILDTIDQKADNLHDLKRSLSTFDKQFLSMYHSQPNQRKNYVQTKKPQYQPQCPPPKPQNNNFLNVQPSLTTLKNTKIPQQNTLKLKLPKPNTLTDQFMKTLLGAQSELIEEYDRTVHPGKYQQKVKEEVKKNAKQLFSQTVPRQGANIIDLNQKNREERLGPFYDEQYYTYLKTNMKYLSQINSKNARASPPPSNGTKIIDSFRDQIKNQFSHNHQILPSPCSPQFVFQIDQQNSFLSKRAKNQALTQASPQKIVQKLQQTGGIQNTIEKMQKSLKKNQLKHMQANQYIVKKPQFFDQFSEKRLSLNRTNEYFSKSYLGAKTKNSALENQLNSTENKINFNDPRARHNVLKIAQQQENIFSNKRDHRNLLNPSIFNQQAAQSHKQSRHRNWRQKSESLRHKIEHSLERF